MEDLILAKLVTIEKLLIVLLSERRFDSLLQDAGEDVHREYGEELNRLFPSDPAHAALSAIVSNFSAALSAISTNVQFKGGSGG